MKRGFSFIGQSPLLYLIPTPIGNLSEMSPRALEILSGTDFIAAEDTRNSGQLMKHYSIDKPFISCHEHNEEEASTHIVKLLLEGKKVCYMSDAGYPGISDPGERLVKKCLENQINVSVVSGPSAGLDALVCSGLDCSHYYFEGFLPVKEGLLKKELTALSVREETIILYESPHRIKKTLVALAKAFPERQLVIARELTKAHEEFVRGTTVELSSIDETTLKGEMVLILEGNKHPVVTELSEQEIVALLKKELKDLSSKKAIEKVSQENGLSKNDVYKIYLANFKK